MDVSQPVFNGFQTYYAVSEAEADVRAGRQLLRSVENRVLLAAATAYADVYRDAHLVRIGEENVKVLSQELVAAQARRSVGEVTRTDVAQARARRARAISSLDQARANLRASRASFLRIVGREAGNLHTPWRSTAVLPMSLDEAISIARAESPAVVAALYREQASRHAVSRERGSLLPRVDVEASVAKSYELGLLERERSSASVLGRLTVPLYRGGEVRARVRQAKHVHVSRLQEVEQARVEAAEAATAAWAALQAAQAQQKSDRVQIEAAQIALAGVREEEQVGQRTVLDRLDAEQELFEAKGTAIRNDRNLVVAHYRLLNSLGRLEAARLKLTNLIYNPEAHYHDARRKWLTLSITRPADTKAGDEAMAQAPHLGGAKDYPTQEKAGKRSSADVPKLRKSHAF